MTRKDCLMAAIDAVCKDRENTYGSPEDNFKLIADLWSTYTGAKIGPQDVAVMMILLKTARAKNSNHDDNFVDIAGYAACAAEIGEPGEREKPKFRLEDYIYGKYALHCGTKEKAAVFCRFLYEHGKEWIDGELFINETNWEIFLEDTVYFLDYFAYQNVEYAKNNGYQVLEFDDFDWK